MACLGANTTYAAYTCAIQHTSIYTPHFYFDYYGAKGRSHKEKNAFFQALPE